MLPVSTGAFKLSSESEQKLDQFYYRYCSGLGENRFGHLIYACHASFPLLLSPHLSNLIWLNFRNYFFKDSSQAVDRISVTDFLLSPLVRPISGKQFEVIPDIRTYLLYLLQDGKWFNHHGIQNFGPSRLRGLADFLHQYFLDKNPKHENYSQSFREVNEWAALAYTNPDKLAFNLASALKKNIEDKNEPGQLRLNVLLDRVGQQYDLNIHEKETTARQFINLRRYGNANRSQLFGESEEKMAEYLMELDEPFIKTKEDSTAAIELPINPGIGQRLERKKKKVQRVISLLIAVDKYQGITSLNGCVQGAMELEEFIKKAINDQKIFDSAEIHKLFNEEATRDRIFSKVEELVLKSNPEDILLFYFSGHGDNYSIEENKIIPADYQMGASRSAIKNTSISDKEFLERIKSIKQFRERGQIVFIMDTHTGFYSWTLAADIFIGGVNHTTQSETRFGDKTSSAFAEAFRQILNQTKGRITYRDLFDWLRHKMENEFPGIKESPVMMISERDRYNFFLSHGKAPIEDGELLVRSNQPDVWHVIPQDLCNNPAEKFYNVYDYEKGGPLSNESGEVDFEIGTQLYEFSISSGANLDESSYYRIREVRPTIYRIPNPSTQSNSNLRILESTGANRLNDALRDLGNKPFALWNDIDTAIPTRFKVKNYNPTYATYYWTDQSYELSIMMINEEKELRLEIYQLEELKLLFNGTLHEVMRKVEDFARYYRIDRLSSKSLPSELKAEIFYRFGPLGGSGLGTPSREKISISSEDMFIEGGKIKLRLFTTTITNLSAYRIFCVEYLLFSDFTVKRIGSVYPGIIPNETYKGEKDLSDLLLPSLQRGIQVQYKALLSSDHSLSDYIFQLNLAQDVHSAE